MLSKLAVNRNPVLDLAAAEGTLLAGLNDKRPDNAKAAAGVLGLLDSANHPAGAAGQGAGRQDADDLKIACYKACRPAPAPSATALTAPPW